jgi:hypothetical protein
LGVAVAALAAAVALSACSSSSGGGGSSSDSPSAPASSGAAAGTGGTGGTGAPGQGGPAASGTVAAISGTTMQVQNQQTGQVAVAWSASTKFSHQVTTTLTAVKAGDCVTAIAPSGTDAAATSFTATTLTVSTAVDGTCGAGAGRVGGGGQRPSGFPSGQRPSGFPSGGASGRPNFGAIAGGKVTSVSGSTLVIAARQFGQNSSNSTATTNKSVTVGATTKITTEASTTSTSVQVGKCVTAQGKADSSGTVAATTVRITDPTNGQCATGFGGGANGG